MQPEAKEALITRLIPLAYVITPNLPEAEVITGLKINDLASMEQAARAIHKMGAKTCSSKAAIWKMTPQTCSLTGKTL